MILRTVLAVAVAVALCAVSLPAIEAARVDAANARVEATLDRVDAAAARLAARNDPTSGPGPGARRTITVHLPTGTWGTARLDSIGLPASPDGPVRYRVAGGSTRTFEPSAPLVGNGTIETGKTRRLRLELVERGDRAVVDVSRPDI